MYFEKFQEINNNLNVKLNDSDLNYARLILPKQKGSIAVVGKYAPNLFSSGYIRLGKKLNIEKKTGFNGFYYGASPLLNSTLIIEAISNMQFLDEEGLNDFISKNASLFMLHEGQEKYLLSLAKYITLCFTYNYGIKFNFKDAKLVNSIVKDCDLGKNFVNANGKFLIIHGSLNKNLFNKLNKYKYICNEEGVSICDDEEGISISDVYKNKTNINLINGDVFYSGVFLRTLKIEEKDIWHSNKDITSMYMYYERSTYATVFALDNNLIDHCLLKDVKENIIEFFCADDEFKNKFLKNKIENGKIGRKKLIDDVNEYLKHSYNVNQIGVTGNVITSDGFLVYGKRNKNAIDAGKIYASVNGNAEIADGDVEFYTDSVGVDFPTIYIDKTQNSFGLELSREAEAELNLSINNNLWKCYGIVISGIVPNEKMEKDGEYLLTHRRLHFNLVYKQKINLDFKIIRKLHNTATEKYENYELHGLILKTYTSLFEKLKKKMGSFFRGIMKYKSITTSLFTIALFCLSLNTIGLSLKDWSAMVSFIFAILVVWMTSADIVRELNERKNNKKYEHKASIVVKKGIDEQIDCVLENIFKRNSFHPVAYIAFQLYLIEEASVKKKF